MPTVADAPAAAPPTVWIRIFAQCLALKRLEMSPEDSVRMAIEEFQRLGHLQPEQAIALH